MNPSLTLCWVCPVCQDALTPAGRSWHCANNHNFDLAKSGYVNLLLAHQKASKQPGDSAAMLKARREFLDAGFFQPIAQAISQYINKYAAPVTEQPRRLLDLGCGEGYYLRQLHDSLHGQWLLAGLDIAKDGVQMAAKADPHSTWVCASSSRIPLADNSLDVLLRVFAPADQQQSLRVLREHGLLVAVTPAAEHLVEIKQALYDQVTLHAKPSCPEGFEVIDEQQVSYELLLDTPAQIQALLAMTPFFWRGQKSGRENLLKLHQLKVRVATWVSCYRKC